MLTKVYKLLLLWLLVLLIPFLSLIIPTNTFASELIGTHLGEGDVGFQINIIKNVLIPKGLEPGSPVTVMIPVTMLQESQINTVQALAAAVASGGYFPIVRINGVCENFTDETGKTASQAVAMARAAFGPQALLVWGNEVNNKQNECNDWLKYRRDYAEIAGQPNVSPAALDYYMGNPAYTVSTMFAETPGMAELFNTPPRAANAYGCIGSNAENCDPLSTNTHLIGYAQAGNPFYLTEFSLSPEGNSANAPDTDLVKVVQFISNRAPETGAVKVTPLVRNVCNNEGQWLLYINGRLFTNLGNEVNPEDCEVTDDDDGDSNYFDLLEIYPYYDVDETKFYLAPVRSLLHGGSPARTLENLRKELASQGYEAYCAQKDVIIEPEYNTKEKIEKYLKQYPNDPKYLVVESIEQLNTTNTKYPLWRDVSNKQFLLASLEEYFGFKDVYVKDASLAEITSAPVNSLLSEPQLCVQGWRNLVAQELACERLERPGECELFTRPIPDTTFTVATLLGALKAYEPLYREGMAKIGCDRLVTQDRAANERLFKGLINTPTYFDRAYRWGFLVAAIHTLEPGTESGNIATKIFNFFTGQTRVHPPRDEVLAVAFKLPDIATNKFANEDAGIQFWDDPTSLTRLALSTHERNQYHEADPGNESVIVGRDEKAHELLSNAIAANIQSENSLIYCYDGAFPDGKGSVSCNNAITKALTDIINGNAQDCEKLEEVSFITDFAGMYNIYDKYGKEFNQNNGAEVILNLFLGDATHPPEEEVQKDPQIAYTRPPAQKLRSLFTISRDTWPPEVDNTTVDFYLVYPKGFELKAVENAMKAAFFTRKQMAALDDLHKIENFEFKDYLIGLTSTTDGFEYVDIEATARGDCGSTIGPGGTEVNIPCIEIVTVTVNQQPVTDIGTLGSRMGYWLRQIQKQLNARASEAWDYFDSCKTTEEFLLGKCEGGNFGFDGGGGNDGDDGVSEPDPIFGYETCGVRYGTGYCAPEYLLPFFIEANIENPEMEASKASRICQRESGSSPYAFNARCLQGTSVDYSVGLFQINMLPRCEGAFKDGNGVPDTDPDYDPFVLPCEIVDQERLNSCALDKLAIGDMAASIINAHLPPNSSPIEPDNPSTIVTDPITGEEISLIELKARANIRAMVQIRKAWGNWEAWKRPEGYCSIE